MERAQLLDILGVGFGPANIAFAVALEELAPEFSVRFLERAPHTSWQAGMQLADADIQNNPLRNLVTPRNPRSRYSFVNFLFEQGRLFEHLNMGRIHPFRVEYEQYVAWVANHFAEQVSYATTVSGIDLVRGSGRRPPHFRVRIEDGSSWLSRSVVVAPGRTPLIPEPFVGLSSTRCVHLTRLLPALEHFDRKGKPPQRIAVVGGSQSAVEIILHLSGAYPEADIECFFRSFSFRLKDTSPFTEEVYFPEFIDRFFNANPCERQRLKRDVYASNYSASDLDVLESLYQRIYQQKITDALHIHLHGSTDIASCSERDEKTFIDYRLLGEEERRSEGFDLVVLATGFRDLGCGLQEERYPSILDGLADVMVLDAETGVRIERDYRLGLRDGLTDVVPCFLNGLCESTHGLGDAGSFSLLALRSERIVQSIKSMIPVSERGSVSNLANERHYGGDCEGVIGGSDEEIVEKMDWRQLVHEYELDAKRLLPWEGLNAPFGGAWCVVRAHTNSQPHAHDEHELFICMQGEATVVVNDERIEVKQGDLVTIPLDAHHFIENPNDVDFHMYSLWWDRTSVTGFLSSSAASEPDGVA